MIVDAENSGRIRKGDVLIEPTSGSGHTLLLLWLAVGPAALSCSAVAAGCLTTCMLRLCLCVHFPAVTPVSAWL
jgi:hypothetical protein